MKKNTTPAVETKKATAKTNTKKSSTKKTTAAPKSDAEKEKEELDKILGPEKSKETPVKKSKKETTKDAPKEKPVKKNSRKKVTDTPTEAPVQASTEAKPKKSRKKVTAEPVDEPVQQIATAADGSGRTYKIDTAKHTCKRIATSFDELDLEALNLDEMPMEVYQKYMRERFPDEEFPIKKNKLFCKGFRISCSVDEGFKVEDTTQRYRVVELPFDGIPSPKELVDFLCSPKASAPVKSKKEKEAPVKETKPSVDVENPTECRKVVSKELARLAKAGEKLDLKKFVELVPFKRWQKTIRKYYKQYTEKKVRYPKLIQMIADYTKSETFVEEPPKPKYKFSATILPEFKKVGMLVGDKLEVDGKKVDAVPFLVDYILHYAPKAMAQMMRWAEGVITDFELLKNPWEADPYIEFNKKAFKSGKHNADVLTALCPAVEIIAPQDLLYTDELSVGDKIMLWEDGRWATKTVTSTEEGIEYGRGIGVMKFDKWLKVPAKEGK